jgi:Flp pilus assembly protein TadD
MAIVANRTARRRAEVAAELASAFQHHQAGRFARAAARYRKILDKSPDNPDALHLLGLLALREGRGERAVQLIGKAVTVLPGFAEAHSNLGNANRLAGHIAEASANYRRAIALRPDFAPAYSNLGQLLCEPGEFCRRAGELPASGGVGSVSGRGAKPSWPRLAWARPSRRGLSGTQPSRAA